MSDYNTVEVPRELLEEWYNVLRFYSWAPPVDQIIDRIEELIPEYTEGEVAP